MPAGVTTLYFEAEREDDLRKVGYSKERRVDPQVIVGLLVDRAGFPLQVGCWEGNKAETTTIIPIVEAFRACSMVCVSPCGRTDTDDCQAPGFVEAGLSVAGGCRL